MGLGDMDILLMADVQPKGTGRVWRFQAVCLQGAGMGGRGLGEQRGHQDTRSEGLRFVQCWNEDVCVRMPRG